MKCTVEVDGRSIPLEWRGGTAIQYKRAFKQDPLADLMALIDLVDSKGEIETSALAGFDTEIIYRIFWTSARVAADFDHEKINEDFYEFLDEFDALPVVDILQDGMMDMLIESMVSTKQAKNFRAPTKKKK